MRKSTSLKVAMSFILAQALGAVSASADAHVSPVTVGALVGLGSFNQSLGTQPTLGVIGNYQLCPEVGVGLVAHIALMGGTVGPGTVTSMSYYNAQVNYSLSKWIPTPGALWVGARAGLAYFHQSLNVALTNNTAAFNLGPALGYDYPLFDGMTAGLDFSYLFASINSVSVNSFNSLLALKYQF